MCYCIESCMSARKVEISNPIPVTLDARPTRLTLSENSVVLHKNGIEFRSVTAFSPWAEMTIALQSPRGGKVNCTGVVISCTGNKHAGYHVSLVFTGLSKVAEARLSAMALDQSL
jgi:hypothetical protein